MMSSTDPWLTLGRDFEACLAIVKNAEREVYVADDGRGAFVGYIQTICVAPDARSKGLGIKLVEFAEERIFRETKNVFLCVSSLNPSEFLMRKTRGPIIR